MPKSNICVIGLSRIYIDHICSKLAVRLDMFYANVEKIMEYELVDKQRIEEICGSEFFLKEVRSIIKRICSFEDTLINLDYSALNNESVLNSVRKNCLLIYVRLSENRFLIEQDNEDVSENLKLINKDLYQDRDNLCLNMSDIVVDANDLDDENLIQKVIEEILNYYT